MKYYAQSMDYEFSRFYVTHRTDWTKQTAQYNFMKFIRD